MSAEEDPGRGAGEPPASRSDELGATYEPPGAVEAEEPASESPAPAGATGEDTGAAGEERPARHHVESPNMLPGRESRRTALERTVVRLIATCGIIGIGVAIAAIMVSSKSQGWIVGLVVSIVSVVLAALLWSSKQL
jgi:hypothetical protein